MSTEEITKPFDNEQWRWITPILLTFLTFSTSTIGTMGWFILNDVKKDISEVKESVSENTEEIKSVVETLHLIDKSVAEIKADRFTSKDGLALSREIGQKADKKDVPPSWLKDLIANHGDRLKTLEARN